MSIAAGIQLGRYEIRSQLGAGGMGEVYLARDTQLERTVALKLLPADVASDQQRMQRFVQEARTASGLNHPNIITIYEIGEADTTHFIATEFIDGLTLRQRMTNGRMRMGEALDVSVQVAAALSAAHAAGIAHRDVKPENIMVRHDGYIKVLDFGLAKPTERQASLVDTEAATKMLVNTSPGMVMGTVSYMSPEQTRGYALDARTDIWSLGIVLYEMVTGRVPFAGETTSDVIVAVLDREPLPLSEYLPEAPPELQRIVRKALRKDREERYQSVKDMLVDLRALKQELEFEDKLDRSLPPDGRSGTIYKTTSGQSLRVAFETNRELAAQTQTHQPPRSTSSAELIIQEIKRHKGGALLAASIISLIVLSLIGFIVYRMARSHGESAAMKPFQSTRICRLTSTGNSVDVAISPDGKYIAHVVNDGAQLSLWVKQVATTTNKQLVAPVASEYHGVTFSPDSNYVYYVKGERNRPLSELFQVSVLGGDSRKLLSDVDSAVTFSPDGKRLAFMRNKPTKKEIDLLIANADGSNERTLSTHRNAIQFNSPSWSPDGKTIACASGDKSNAQASVIGINVEDGAEQPLTSQRWRFIERLAWLPSGEGLALLAPSDETSEASQIWLLSYPGGEARRITNDLNIYAALSFSSDSASLATVQTNVLSNVWVAPNADADRARQITTGSSRYYSLSWATDGRILYASNSGGNLDVYISAADGSNQKQLTINANSNFGPVASPDGRYIAFISNRAGAGYNIWRMDMNGGNLKQLKRGGMESNPQCTPDGRWVVYTSWEAGKPTIWKVSIDGGEAQQLTDKYSMAPVVSPDGKQFACSYWDEQYDTQFDIAIIPIEGGAPVKTFDLPTMNVRWSSDGRALTYIETRDNASNIWGQPLAGGPARQLTNWKSDRIFNFAWSRDGKQLALARGVVSNDVVLISDARMAENHK
ncbi:MAG: eukaryotic-like serine/threonine-protein kinase [Blastocatellia bacterium]|jgi:serine/threonine protein kinase|nr:eukaryotic-like serine/threonine-protein kinase [Blastocatellia bacterium]